jgi:hypothetical protein
MSATGGLLAGFRRRLGPASSGRAARPDRAKTGIALVSSNFGGIDAIKPFPAVPGVDTLYYTDADALADTDPEVVASWGRIIVPDYPRYDFGPRLRAKYFKLQIHRLPETESYRWLAWADSAVQFRDASFLLRETERLAPLAPHQRLALVPHPDRNTIREEYEWMEQQVATGGEYAEYLRVRYAQEKITEQMNFFAGRGWNLDAKLWCGTIWLIENNDLITRCWDGWWDQNLRYGIQDQLSLPVMLDVFGLEPQALPLYVWKNEFWEHVKHQNLVM